MAFWKIKFGKKKINLFKGVCMLTESVNKSFLLTLSSCLVLWLWRQRVALMKESLSGFSFECDSRPSEARSWTLADEGKKFAGQSIRLLLYWLSGLWFSLRLSQWLPVCYLYRNRGSKNRPKILARRHLLTNHIGILLFYFRA